MSEQGSAKTPPVWQISHRIRFYRTLLQSYLAGNDAAHQWLKEANSEELELQRHQYLFGAEPQASEIMYWMNDQVALPATCWGARWSTCSLAVATPPP